METNRRTFLRHSLNVLGAVAAGTAACKAVTLADSAGPNGSIAAQGESTSQLPPADSAAAARQGVPGRKWVMAIDLSKCDGCGHCQVACGKMHFIPPDRQYIKVLKMQEAVTTAPYYFPSALWAPHAPIPLVATIFVLVGGVWSCYVFVVAQILSIRKAGGP